MGTYVAVKFDHATKRAIHRFCAIANIPNMIRPDKLHSTLMYSKTDLVGYEPQAKYDLPFVAYPIGAAVWDTTNDAGEVDKCLVVLLDCPPMLARHELLMKECDGSYPFPTYQPHVTLSYNVGNLDIESLPFIENYIPHFVIVGEYSEPLNEPIDTSCDAINKTVVVNA